MGDTLLRSDPPQLRVGDEAAPCCAHVSRQLGESLADELAAEQRRSGADELVASANRKGETMTGERGRGVQDDVCCRVVGLVVHCVGTREVEACGESQV